MTYPRLRYALADRFLPPTWRWLLGDDAMLHERDLRRISRRNDRRRQAER